MKRALLLSGGIDSICLAYWLKPEIAFTVNYGQRGFLGELRASRQVSSLLSIEHHVIEVEAGHLGSGDMSTSDSVALSPSTEWWPYRNQFIITIVAMKALSLGVNELLCGSIADDHFHADGTQEFFARMDHLLSYQEGGMRVSAPAIKMTAVDLVRESNIPMSILAWAHSCHKSEFACDDCRGCAKYHNVMYQLKRID